MTGRVGDDRLRVMVVEDHPLVRAAIRQAISDTDLEVVGEAANAEEAFAKAPALRPDVLLLDINLSGVSGLQLLRDLAPRLPETSIVMLTASSEDRDVMEALRNGAVGYLTKDLSPEALRRAIRGIRAGDLPMPRKLAARAIQRLARVAGRSRETGNGVTESLSEREEEVLRLLSNGLTDREIAAVLGISPRTVETHVSRILSKLHVNNRAEAARVFREAG
jgi:DNA-binding NarL/FixJ family response regulator